MAAKRHASTSISSHRCRDAVTFNPRPLSWPSKVTIVYGAAHFGKSLLWYVSELFFAFYLTEIAGIDPQLTGVVLGIGLAASAAIDLLVGWQLRGGVDSARTAGSIQAAGAVASASFLLAVFLTDHLPPTLRFGYAIAIGLSFRIAYALFDIPQNALLSLREWPDLGRHGVSAMRLVGSGLAMLAVSLASGYAFAGSRRAGEGGPLLPIILLLAVIAIATAVGLRRSLLRENQEHAIPQIPGRLDWQSLVPPTALVAVASMAFSMFTRLEPYFGVHTLHSAQSGARVAAAFSLGTMMSQPAWALFYARSNRLTFLIAAAIGLLCATLAFAAMAADSYAWALLLGGLGGAMNGGFSLLAWSWFAETTARHAGNRTAIAFAIFAAASKLALAVAGLTVGFLLSIMDYRATQAADLPVAMTVSGTVAAALCLTAAALYIASRRLGTARHAQPGGPQPR